MDAKIIGCRGLSQEKALVEARITEVASWVLLTLRAGLKVQGEWKDVCLDVGMWKMMSNTRIYLRYNHFQRTQPALYCRKSKSCETSPVQSTRIQGQRKRLEDVKGENQAFEGMVKK